MGSVVVLCGSVKLRQWFDIMERDLVRGGKTPLSCCWAFSEKGLTSSDKEALDALHKRKIDLADVVIVITDGHIGESAQSEIDYAKSKGIPVGEWRIDS